MSSSDIGQTLVVYGLLLSSLTGVPSLGIAQSLPDSTTGDTTAAPVRLEPLLDSFESGERSFQLISERIAALADNPLPLNRTSSAQLAVLPGLSGAQAHRIVQYRQKHGAFESLSGIEAIDGVSSRTLQGIRPFLIIESPSKVSAEDRGDSFFRSLSSNLELDIIQRFSRDLDLGRGYHEDRFLGPPGRLTTRLRGHSQRRLEFALTLDKDPGEPIRWSPSSDTYGFDHVSGSLTLRQIGPVETLVLGDFTTQFGQGVALWQGISFGKGRDPITPAVRSGRGIVPYRSASESNFFRGAATTIALPGSFSVTAFGSRRARDASLDSTLTDSMSSQTPIPIRTLSSGGRHRTPSELARKGTFTERSVGGALEYRSSILHVGLSGYRSGFDRPLRPGNRPYRTFRVSGRNTSMISAYATVYPDDYVLFGEVARSPNGVVGGILGAALDQGGGGQAILVGRYYPAPFPNFHGNAFGESGGAQNEIGLYTGIQLQIAEDWRIAAYVDQYRFPWIKFNVPRPSSGWESRTVLSHTPRPWLSTYLQFRTQVEETGTTQRGPGQRPLEGLQSEKWLSARWHAEYSFSDALTLRTRLEWSHYSTPETTASGFFLSEGVRFEPISALQLDARIAFFDTDGYSARIYAYEHDLLYSFSVPAFFDRGRRTYVLVEYAPSPALTIEAKYGITRYDNRSTVGSGLNRIDRPLRRKISIQLRWEI